VGEGGRKGVCCFVFLFLGGFFWLILGGCREKGGRGEGKV